MDQSSGLKYFLVRLFAFLARAFGLQHLLAAELKAGGANQSTSVLPSSAEVASLIRKRRSVFPKDYVKGAVVTDDNITAMLESANWAPTHGKTEPWRFSVLASHSARLEFYGLVRQVMQDTISEPDELQKRAVKLDALISKKEPFLSHLVVIGCRRAPNDKGTLMPEWEDMAAVACAVQNLHLQATAMGIAGYWSSFPAETVRNSPVFKAKIGLAPDDRCMGVFFLGRSNALDSYRAKRGPLQDKVIWQR